MKTTASKTSDGYFKDVLPVLEEYMMGKPDKQPEGWLEKAILPLMVRMFPGMVLVIDLHTNGYVYISDNAQEMIGYDPQEFLAGGLPRALQLFPDAHKQIVMYSIFPVLFSYFEKYAKAGESDSITASYPTQLIHRDGTIRWYLHTIKIMTLDAEGRPHFLLKTLSDIQDVKTDPNISFSISRKTRDGKTDILFKEQFLPETSFEILSARETEILQWISRGLTNAQIAAQLFISIHTVQTHRKNILKKTACKGTAGLAAYALTGQYK